MNIKEFTLEQLQTMPTIAVGQTDDLKFDNGVVRVWLSRMSVEDGAPYDNQVTIERNVGGKWKIIKQFQAK